MKVFHFRVGEESGGEKRQRLNHESCRTHTQRRPYEHHHQQQSSSSSSTQHHQLPSRSRCHEGIPPQHQSHHPRRCIAAPRQLRIFYWLWCPPPSPIVRIRANFKDQTSARQPCFLVCERCQSIFSSFPFLSHPPVFSRWRPCPARTTPQKVALMVPIRMPLARVHLC